MVASHAVVWHYAKLLQYQCSKELSMDNGNKKNDNNPISPSSDKQSFFGNLGAKINLMNFTLFGYTPREIALMGLYPAGKTGMVWPTQPLAKISGVQQASVIKEDKPLNFVQATKRIASTPGKGITAFWDASVASANRMFVQSLYKGPLQIGASDLSKKIIPNHVPGLHIFRGLLAGFIVGVTDPMLLGPLERYKTWKLLQQGKSENFIGYLRTIRKQQNNDLQGVLKELYRGVGVTVLKQSMMNGTLFISKGFATDFVKPYEKDHPITSMAFSSIAPGMAAAAVGAPADFIKTLMQQHTGGKTLTVKELFQATIKKSGWKGLFTGLPAKFILISSGYAFNALFLNLFDKYRNADKNSKNQPPSPQSVKESAAELMEQMRQNSPHISSEDEKMLAEYKLHIQEALAECLAEWHYDDLSSKQAIRMLTQVMAAENQNPLEQLNKFTLQELLNVPQKELVAMPASELALRMPRGGIFALLVRFAVTPENQKTIENLSQYSVEQLEALSEEELEQFHLQLFGALLNNPEQTSEDTPEKRIFKDLIERFEDLDINSQEKTEKAVEIISQKSPSLLFALRQQEEYDTNYFAALAQRAGDESHNISFDFSQDDSDVKSKKRTLLKE